MYFARLVVNVNLLEFVKEIPPFTVTFVALAGNAIAAVKSVQVELLFEPCTFKLAPVAANSSVADAF